MVAFPVLGLVTRRWAAVALPLICWPIYFAGLDRGWWFYGTGDGWQTGAVAITALSVASTAVATLVARRLKPPSKTRYSAKPS